MNKRIKVLHVIESIARGGAENNLLNLLKYMDRNAFENKVLYLYNGSELKDAFGAIGVDTMCAGMRSIRDLSRGMGFLIKEISRGDYDMVHTQLFGANLYGRAAAFITGKRVVTTLQNPDYTFERKNAIVRKMIDKITVLITRSRFIAVSRFVKQSFVKELHLNADNIEVINNSLDLDRFTAENNGSKIFLPNGLDGKRYILNIGRLHLQKGQAHLIKAVKRIIESGEDLGLVIIGDGPLKTELADLAKRSGLGERVHFVGKVEDVLPYLKHAAVFAFPSIYEGLPVALLEAMAAGIPCVASGIPSIKEVENASGAVLLVDPADTELFAGSIKKILHDTATRDRMVSAAFKIVSNSFDARKNSAKLGMFFKKVLGIS